MGFFDGLFPVKEEGRGIEWREHLTTNTAVSPGLAEWRAGQTPLIKPFEIRRVERYPVATLHPGHKNYPSIETAKRKRATAYEDARQRELYSRQFTTGRTRDGREFPILRINSPEMPYGRVSIRQFNRVLRLRMPPEFE